MRFSLCMHGICTLTGHRKIFQTVGAPGHAGRGAEVDERQATLQKAFPRAFDSSFDNKEKSAEDYPLVRFWNKGSFDPTMFRNVDTPTFGRRLHFLEDEMGQRISQGRLDDIRADLALSFKEVKKKIPSIHGESWTQIDRDIQDACSLHLIRRFSELALCARGWKFQSLMVEWFANWNRDRKSAKGKATKKEENDTVKCEETIASTIVPAKRNNDTASISPHQTKKLKQTAPTNIVDLLYGPSCPSIKF